MGIKESFSNIMKNFYGTDSGRPQPEQRKGLFNFSGSLVEKKQQKNFVLNAQTLERLAQTDPITWSIMRTIKARVNSTGWNIVPDTERIEKELDRWEDYVIESLNPYGIQDAPFNTTVLKSDLFDEIGTKLTKMLTDPKLGNRMNKIKAVRWLFKTIKRRLVQEAEVHCEEVKKIFEKPNTSAETSLRSLQELVLSDILVHDAGVIIKNYSESDELAELYTVPGHEIKIYRNEDRTTPQAPEPAYVWEEQGIQRAEFTNDELIYIKNNPTQTGYGISPLEVATFIIMASLYTDTYYIDYLKNSNVPPGLISLGENITDDQRKIFQRLWDQEVQGRAGGIHRMLFMSGSNDMKFIPLNNLSNRDMQMMEYLNWTVAIKCACFGVSPQDIGFTQDMRGIGSGGVAEQQALLTQSRGIDSMLDLLEQYYNAEIVKTEFDFQDVKFEWILKESKDESKQAMIDINDINAGIISRNERRIRLGLKPIAGGDVIAIPTGQGFLPIEDLEAQTEQPLEQELQDQMGEEMPQEGLTGEPTEEEFEESAEESDTDEPFNYEKFIEQQKMEKNRKSKVRVTINKAKSKNEQHKLLNETVKKLRDSGVDAELRIGFDSQDITKAK